MTNTKKNKINKKKLPNYTFFKFSLRFYCQVANASTFCKTTKLHFLLSFRFDFIAKWRMPALSQICSFYLYFLVAANGCTDAYPPLVEPCVWAIRRVGVGALFYAVAFGLVRVEL